VLTRFRLAPIAPIACLTLLSAQALAAPPHLVAPTVKTHTEPGYPSPELAAGRDATVVLFVTVDREGHVVDAVVETSQGPNFDEAALVTARQWAFFPAERDGVPVAAKIKVPFHFAPPPGKIVTPPEAAKHEHAQGEQVSVDEHVHPEEVRIYGRAGSVSRGASDFNLHIGELDQVPRKNASALLNLAPGFFLNNEGGDGHAEQIFVRGFDAREGQDLAISVGGVPVNESGNLHANGYADTHFVLPELVESVRVVEGPFDPRQGNYAVAGSAEYNLGLAARGVSARTTLGSFGTQRLLILWGPKAASQHTFGGAEIYKSDGFGTNRASKRASAMAQYEGSLGENGSYRVLASAYGTDYQAAGLLRRDDEQAGRKDFYGSYDTRQGGNATRFSIAADVELNQKDVLYYAQLYVVSRAMRLLENFTGFAEDTQATESAGTLPQRGDLIDRDIASSTLGTRGYARIHTRAFGRKHELEVGYAARYDTVTGTQQRIDAKSNLPYVLEFDNRPKLSDIGLYLDGTLRPLPRVAIKAGLRANLFTFDVLSAEQNLRATAASIALLPRATLEVGPYDGLSFTGSYGHGVRTTDPVYVVNRETPPFASVKAYEGAVVYTKTVNALTLSARSIFFGTHVDRDLIFSQSEGRNTPANGTTRTGWIGALRLTHPWFEESAHLTLVRASFDDTGLPVLYVPSTVLRSDTAVHHDLPWKLGQKPIHAKLSAGLSTIGKRPLPNAEYADRIFTLDASAAANWGIFMIDVSASNLLNSRQRLGEYNFTSDWQNQGSTPAPARHFAAGPPRSVFITLGMTLGGDS
jgi:iron complex outermembrane recepter protein